MQKNDLKTIMITLRSVTNSVHRQFNYIARDSGLKGHHVRYIELLSREGPMSAKALSEGLHIDKGHTSRVLAELIGLRLVCRTGAGRGALVSLTPEGQALSCALTDNIDHIAGLIAAEVSDAELEAFLGVTKKIEEVFKSQTDTEQRLP